jgi:hypothetical protein
VTPRVGSLGAGGVGVLGPGERSAAVFPVVDEPFDGGGEVGDGRKVAAPQRLPGEDREEDLDQVQPRVRGRRKVRSNPRMAREPGAHRGVLVGRLTVSSTERSVLA